MTACQTPSFSSSILGSMYDRLRDETASMVPSADPVAAINAAAAAVGISAGQAQAQALEPLLRGGLARVEGPNGHFELVKVGSSK